MSEVRSILEVLDVSSPLCEPCLRENTGGSVEFERALSRIDWALGLRRLDGMSCPMCGRVREVLSLATASPLHG